MSVPRRRTPRRLFFTHSTINWAGFYWLRGQELVLGPFQGQPACVRIPLGRGVCGTAAAEARTVLVPDVHDFPGHIACDTRSRSELVVPLIGADGLFGVLDLDSPLPARFTADDQAGCERLAEVLAGIWPDRPVIDRRRWRCPPAPRWRRRRSRSRNPPTCPSKRPAAHAWPHDRPANRSAAAGPVERRDAHQPGQGGAETGLARADETIGVGARHAGFLRFAADVDFDQQRRRRPFFSIAAAIASAIRGGPGVSITSASRTASRALLVCRPPMMCRLSAGNRRARRGISRRAS